ncbi:MAG: GNAT family N-acetyltransferase [Gemmatimonadetes bacterium]|nr:GNAT family N-acetyltransferase [Gemmatimonadota bacterium]
MTRAPGLEAAHVRAASSADWPAIAALLTASRLPVVGAEAHVADFLVAEADGRLVGAVGLERYAEGALLRSAVVDADWRGRGMGELLVRRCIARARTARACGVTCTVAPRAPHARAARETSVGRA